MAETLRIFDVTKQLTKSFKLKKNKSRIPKGNACGKIQHKSLLAAQHHMEELQQKSDRKVEVYECSICKRYHVGRK